MDTSFTLEELRQQWNDVLDFIERQDRITWMAFFDARLAAFDGKVLTLDYSDSGKFGGSHQFPETRERQLDLLKSSVKEICGVEIEVEQRP
jgi:hypothetical protein